MDRISALRNIEDALSEFESGDADLTTVENRILTVLRTYATEFEGDGLAAYRTRGADRANGLVVVAESPEQARKRVETLLGTETDDFEVQRLE